MKKIPLKLKLFIITLIILSMIIYNFLFGTKNAVIGIMVVLAALMNLGNDFSFKPKLSFVKIWVLFLILCVVSFLNNPITIWGCLLTFLIVFATTFTSYHLFAADVYMPFLMTYFMMMCIPVSLEELPLRCLALTFGAVFIVGLNLLVNRKKEYKLSKLTMDKLVHEIDTAIDLKLGGREVPAENFSVINGFYSSIFSRFEYRFFPSKNHDFILNVVKSFQFIGFLIAQNDFTRNELEHIRSILQNINGVNVENVFEGVEINTREMYLVLLNLEIVVNELKNRDSNNSYHVRDNKNVSKFIKPILKRSLSFKSARFTFAFKMAAVLTLWEILTLIFNFPFTKWLYFASIPLMVPYVNDSSETAKSRIKGTLGGLLAFTLIMIAVPYVPLPSGITALIIFTVCIFGMILELENKFKLTVFTTIMSVMAALMYIALPEAIILKILWVVVAAIIVSVINFGFLPYSVEKETQNNLDLGFKLNKQFMELIMAKCRDEVEYNKNTLLVVSNIVRENIEVTDENRKICQKQNQITDICNFILTYAQFYEFSDDLKSHILDIIDNDAELNQYLPINEKIIASSVKYANNLLEMKTNV